MFSEPWIERKLTERLEAYKARYPKFKIDRVIEEIKGWDAKSQRWAPYMKDKDIAEVTRGIRKLRSLEALAKNDHL